MKRILGAALAFCLLAGCGNAAVETMLLTDADIKSGEPRFVKTEEYGPWEREELLQLEDADTGGTMGFDLRSRDVASADLAAVRERLARLSFDTDTTWPAVLPEGLNPQEMLDLGKNPGLGVRALQAAGVTGRGVSIAIVDQGLLLEHQEYAGRIMSYELLHNFVGEGASMHGPAVASIAVGSTCGVAPGAKVYYIASTFGTFSKEGFTGDLSYMAQAIRRVLAINELLPEGEKIRAISISKGFELEEKGGRQVFDAIEEAKAAQVLVVTTSLEHNYGVELWGLGRSAAADPENPASYTVGSFFSQYFMDTNGKLNGLPTLFVPMDARSVASFSAADSYAYYSTGGLSWTVPWLAGMYALCLQENQTLAPERFLQLALETGRVNTVELGGKTYTLGMVIDPERLVEAAKNA